MSVFTNLQGLASKEKIVRGATYTVKYTLFLYLCAINLSINQALLLHTRYSSSVRAISDQKIFTHIWGTHVFTFNNVSKDRFPLDCRKNYWINSNLRWNSSWCVSMATAFWELLVLPSPYYGLLLGFPRSTCTENAAEARNFCDWEHGQMSKLLCNIFYLVCYV